MNYSLAETADEALGNAEQAFLHGNLSAADLLCHYVLASYPDHPRALGIRSLLASRLGLAENGSTWLQSGAHPNVPRFLLIKAWGQGFWSDMCHVMASLLVAEITDRIPVVQWGGNSLFHCGGGGGGRLSTLLGPGFAERLRRCSQRRVQRRISSQVAG